MQIYKIYMKSSVVPFFIFFRILKIIDIELMIVDIELCNPSNPVIFHNPPVFVEKFLSGFTNGSKKKLYLRNGRIFLSHFCPEKSILSK